MPPGTDQRGRLIALEGLDGCGKSTQARILAEALGGLLTFEPGATALGTAIRPLLLSTASPISPPAEALLMAADRAQHVDEVIAPALQAGRWVVTDRYNGSTLAYQGWGRGLGVEGLLPVLAFATGGLSPDLTVLVEVPVEVARERMGAAEPDRLERLDAAFHQRVADGYRALARSEDGWAVVDGTGSLDEVAKAVAEAVAGRVGWPGVAR
ncbi:MAG: dTMP kinase [Acidimicrobiales bacterium]